MPLIPSRSRFFLIAGVVVLLAIAAYLVVQAWLAPGSGQTPEPRSYHMTPVWDTKNAGLPLAYHAGSGTVLLWERQNENQTFSPHHISAVDARTGKQKWTGGPQGWDVNLDYIRGGKLTSDGIIVQSNYQQGSPAIAALGLSDGKVLWKLNTPGEYSRPTAVTAEVVVVVWDTTTLRGLNAADGKAMWETRVADGCRADELGGDGELVVIEVMCEKKRYLESLDPKTGKSRWQHTVSIEDKASLDNLSVRGAVAMLRDHDHLLIVDQSGRTVFEEETRGGGDTRLAVTAQLAMLAYRNQTGQDTLSAIDLKQGKVSWSRKIAVASLTFSGGRLYAVGRLPEPLLPFGLYEIDPATGRMAVSPTHLLFAEYDTLVAVDGDVMVSYYWERGASRGISHLEGHRLTPPTGSVGYAGGAPAAQWPDSCSLLNPDEVAAKNSAVSYQERPEQVTVVDALLPRPANCRYQPSSVSAPVVTASIAWVGADVEQSTQMMSRIMQQNNDAKPVFGLGEEAIEVLVFGSPRSTVEVYFRVGPRIGKVSIADDRATALELAKLAVTRLG